MANFKIQSALFLGKEIQICVATTQNVNEPPKGFHLACDILGINTKCYLCPKKDSIFSGLIFFSIEAITICTFMNIDLSSIENTNLAVSKKDEIKKEWNNIHSKCDGDWDKMIAFMSGQDMDLWTKSTSGILTTSEKDSIVEKDNTTRQLNYEQLKKGDIAFEGITRTLVYNEDSISLEAIEMGDLKVTVPSENQGKTYTFNFNLKKPNQNIFFEDIRGITVYEGYEPSNFRIQYDFSFGASGVRKIQAEKAAFSSIPYIRFDLNGLNDPNGNIFTGGASINLYSIPINSSQLNEAYQLKTFLENKIRELRNSSKRPNQSQSSNADDLLKYSTLLDKGVISNEEFDILKKKLLGL